MTKRDPEELTAPEEQSTIVGLLAEQAVRREYGVRIPPGGRTDWKDVEYQNGVPGSVKAALADRRFRLFEEDHDTLTSQQGYYYFVVYRPVTIGDSVADSEIEVLAMKRRKATRVTSLVRRRGGGWNKSGHEKGRQHKVQVEEVFESSSATDQAAREAAE